MDTNTLSMSFDEANDRIKDLSRHSADQRYGIISSIKDFELWQFRDLMIEHNIHALGYKTKWSSEQLHAATKDIHEMYLNTTGEFKEILRQRYMSGESPVRQYDYDLGRKKSLEDYKSSLYSSPLKPTTQSIIEEFIAIRFNADNHAQTKPKQTSIRLNGTYPVGYHIHQNEKFRKLKENKDLFTLTFDFTKNGTWFHSGNNEGPSSQIDGQEYTAGHGVITLFSDNVMPHKADIYDESWTEQPRISMANYI